VQVGGHLCLSFPFLGSSGQLGNWTIYLHANMLSVKKVS
jgi:hypothetical protein